MKNQLCIVMLGCLIGMGCGGADEALEHGQSELMSEESFVLDGVSDLSSYAGDEGKADSVKGQRPVLHIEPDGEWHSINFMNILALIDPNIVLLNTLSGQRQGSGAVVIEHVHGPVEITLVAGESYRDKKALPMWTLGHRLVDGQAMVLDTVYRLPMDQRLRTPVPSKDFLGDDFLDVPEHRNEEGFNRVNLDADQISKSLQVSLSFYNFSGSVRVMVKPVGWHPDDVVHDVDTDVDTDIDMGIDDDALFEIEQRQTQEAADLLERLRQSNVVLEEAISKVNEEIGKLESDLYAKQQRVNGLVDRLDQREDELEDEQDKQKRRNLLMCAFGYCEAVVWSELLRDDSEYQQITRDLESARSEQRSVQSEVSSYHTRRGLLERERREVQRRIETLREALTQIPDMPEFDARPSVVHIAHQIHLTRALSAELKESYQVSLEIRDALLDINWVLDDFIDELEAFDAYIAEYIVRSREDHYRLLIAFLDPDFDVDRWLQKEFQSRAGLILPKLPSVEKEFGKMLAGLVDSAVRDYFDDPDSPDAKLWRDTVLDGLKQSWRTP